MLVRFSVGVLLLLVCLGLGGCDDSVGSQVDEQKNPYFIAGKDRLSARDYQGAVEAFEKAAEVNRRSPLAHFELGVLYEQHDDAENHFVSAMYHYQRAIDLRPNAWPADNARERIAVCKRELTKAESIDSIHQAMQHDLDRLKEENQLLRRQLESWQAQNEARSPVQSRPGPVSNQVQVAQAGQRPNPTVPRNDGANSARATPSAPAREVAGPASGGPAARIHVIKQGETPAAIARQYRIKLETLMAANPSIEPRRLRVGQTLNIPST